MRRSADLPPLLSLRAFEAAARLLSFRRAAGELCVAQSAISHHVAQVERHLGVRLFVRKARGIELTPAAKRYLPEIQQAFAAIAAASAKLRAEESRERLRVSLLPSFAANFLVARLPEFAAREPGIDIVLDPTLDLADVAASAADLAIRYGAEDEMRAHKPLFEERVIPVCSPALAADPARPLRKPADLARHVLLHSDDAQFSWMEWNLWLHAHGLRDLKPAGALQFNQYDQLVQAAVSGQGVALGRLPLLAGVLRERKLVTPFRKSVVSSRGYFLVRSARAASSADAAGFEAWLFAEAKKEAPARP